MKSACIRQRSERVRSKKQSPVYSKCLIAAIGSGELSGCTRMHPIPPVDQSVLKNVGFELSYRRRSGEDTRFILQFSKTSISWDDQATSGNFDDDIDAGCDEDV